jgi:hypothetical protein
MTALLTINTGSTSVKLALFALEGGGAPAERAREHHDGGELDAREVLRALAAKSAEPPEVSVHRIVHGGTRFSKPTLIDSEVLAALEALTPLAPLHNPTAVRWVRAALEVWGRDTRQLAVFDTAYFAQLPRVAAEYALPPPRAWHPECAATDFMDWPMNRCGASGVRCTRVCLPADALSRCNWRGVFDCRARARPPAGHLHGILAARGSGHGHALRRPGSCGDSLSRA